MALEQSLCEQSLGEELVGKLETSTVGGDTPSSSKDLSPEPE